MVFAKPVTLPTPVIPVPAAPLFPFILPSPGWTGGFTSPVPVMPPSIGKEPAKSPWAPGFKDPLAEPGLGRSPAKKKEGAKETVSPGLAAPLPGKTAGLAKPLFKSAEDGDAWETPDAKTPTPPGILASAAKGKQIGPRNELSPADFSGLVRDARTFQDFREVIALAKEEGWTDRQIQDHLKEMLRNNPALSRRLKTIIEQGIRGAANLDGMMSAFDALEAMGETPDQVRRSFQQALSGNAELKERVRGWVEQAFTQSDLTAGRIQRMQQLAGVAGMERAPFNALVNDWVGDRAESLREGNNREQVEATAARIREVCTAYEIDYQELMTLGAGLELNRAGDIVYSPTNPNRPVTRPILTMAEAYLLKFFGTPSPTTALQRQRIVRAVRRFPEIIDSLRRRGNQPGRRGETVLGLFQNALAEKIAEILGWEDRGTIGILGEQVTLFYSRARGAFFALDVSDHTRLAWKAAGSRNGFNARERFGTFRLDGSRFNK